MSKSKEHRKPKSRHVARLQAAFRRAAFGVHPNSARYLKAKPKRPPRRRRQVRTRPKIERRPRPRPR